MSTVTTPSRPDLAAATGAATRTTVTAAGLAAAIACAGIVAGWLLFADISQAAAALEPVNVVACLIAGAAFAVLAVALPGLAATSRLPRIPVTLAALACAFITIPAWTFGTVVPHLAAHTSPAQFDKLGHVDFRLFLLNLPMIVLSLVGFVSLAVTGWRRRAMSRAACVLLVVAAIATVMGDFAPAGILAGIAIAWTARSARSEADN
jgi:hypothetical protein